MGRGPPELLGARAGAARGRGSRRVSTRGGLDLMGRAARAAARAAARRGETGDGGKPAAAVIAPPPRGGESPPWSDPSKQDGDPDSAGTDAAQQAGPDQPPAAGPGGRAPGPGAPGARGEAPGLGGRGRGRPVLPPGGPGAPDGGPRGPGGRPGREPGSSGDEPLGARELREPPRRLGDGGRLARPGGGGSSSPEDRLRGRLRGDAPEQRRGQHYFQPPAEKPTLGGAEEAGPGPAVRRLQRPLQPGRQGAQPPGVVGLPPAPEGVQAAGAPGRDRGRALGALDPGPRPDHRVPRVLGGGPLPRAPAPAAPHAVPGP